jgi:Leucine Rich Repeat
MDRALWKLVSSNYNPAVSLSTCIISDQERLRQRYAYLALMFSTGKWTQLGWYDDDHECDWTGVFCNGSTIINVYLPLMNMQGSIPADIGLWENLVILDFSRNSIAGTLPDTISRMTKLTHFDVSNNQLTGSLPDSLGSMTSLLLFTVANNNLKGTLPSAYGEWRNVEIVNFLGNQLSGSVPATFTNWTSINVVTFLGNGFNGTMPQIGRNFCPSSTGIGQIWADCKAPADIDCACCSVCCDTNGDDCS